MKKRKSYIWMATIPDIFGYGLIVVDKSEELALKALKKEYYAWKKTNRKAGYYSDSTFNSSWEDWGGRTEKIELGKAYNDGFC
jgi:hypothetical protein